MSDSAALRPTPLMIGLTLVMTSASGVIFPLIDDLRTELGISTAAVGVMTAAVFVGMVVAQLTLARFADRGHARAMLLVGLAGAAVTLLWFSRATELWQLVCARGVSGLSIGMFLPAMRAVVAHRDPHHAGQNLGTLSAVELVGWTVVPALSGMAKDQWGLDAPFLILASVAVAGFIVLALSRSLASPARASAPSPVLPLDLARHRPVQVTLLYSAALFLPVGFYDALWSIYLKDRGASTTFVGVSLALYGIPYALLARRGGALADKHGPRPVLWAGLVLIVPVTFIYGLLPTPGLIAAIAFIEAAGGAVANPAAQLMMTRACPPERVAAGLGLSGALASVVAAISGLCAARLYDGVGAATTLGLASATMAALAVLAALLDRSPRSVAAAIPARQ